MMTAYIGNQIVEIPESEVNEIKAKNQAFLLQELLQDSVTNADLIAVILSGYTVTTPAGETIPATEAVDTVIELPFKAGYRWEKVISGTGIAYQLVEDAEAIGSEANPILYTDGVQLINGAYYLVDGVRNIYMGADAGFAEW